MQRYFVATNQVRILFCSGNLIKSEIYIITIFFLHILRKKTDVLQDLRKKRAENATVEESVRTIVQAETNKRSELHYLYYTYIL